MWGVLNLIRGRSAMPADWQGVKPAGEIMHILEGLLITDQMVSNKVFHT